MIKALTIALLTFSFGCYAVQPPLEQDLAATADITCAIPTAREGEGEAIGEPLFENEIDRYELCYGYKSDDGPCAVKPSNTCSWSIKFDTSGEVQCWLKTVDIKERKSKSLVCDTFTIAIPVRPNPPSNIAIEVN